MLTLIRPGISKKNLCLVAASHQDRNFIRFQKGPARQVDRHMSDR
jgi:hypothetical protein